MGSLFFERSLKPLFLLTQQKTWAALKSAAPGNDNLFLFVLQIETLLKSVNPSAGINQFLFSSEERMALGANFNTDILLCRTGMNHIAACAGNGCLFIIWMDVFFHVSHLFRWNRSLTLKFYHIIFKNASIKKFFMLYFPPFWKTFKATLSTVLWFQQEVRPTSLVGVWTFPPVKEPVGIFLFP